MTISEVSRSNRVRTTAWTGLRQAVAEEFVEKLPSSMSVPDVCLLTGRSIAVVDAWIRTGVLVVRAEPGGPRMWPVDNLGFLMGEMLLRLPLPGDTDDEAVWA